MIYSLNIGATHLKMNNYYDCINECNSAIKVGRDNGADPTMIAKAMCRIGFAYRDLGELENAKMFFSSALTEYPAPERTKHKKTKKETQQNKRKKEKNMKHRGKLRKTIKT
jgi:tetratricopeptide (TPR) repeat protein